MTHLKIILLLITTSSICYAQKDLLNTETYFIGNRDFIVYDSNMQIKINAEDGEDLKSKTYSHYYNKLNSKYPQWKDKTTIAFNEMNIDLNIINNTKDSWKIDAISLIIIDKKDISNETKVYNWPYRIRGEEDDINFTISNNKKYFSYIPSNIVMHKLGEGDSLLNINVNSAKADLEKKLNLLSFKFEINLSKVGKDDRIKISSDRIYHICLRQ